MKSGILAAAIIIITFCAIAVHGSSQSTAPARTSATAVQPRNFSTTTSVASPTNSSAARVINTQTLTITGANTVSQSFKPLTIHTAILTITGSTYAPGNDHRLEFDHTLEWQPADNFMSGKINQSKPYRTMDSGYLQ